MSAPISTRSRSSASVSEEEATEAAVATTAPDFDGAEDLLRAWRAGLRPDPHLTVSEWADKHRWLSSRASAEPGRYRT